LLVSFFFLVVLDQAANPTLFKRINDNWIGNTSLEIGDIQGYMLLSKATMALMGSSTWSGILIKVVSRVSPLVMAPRKILSAFTYVFTLHMEHTRATLDDAMMTDTFSPWYPHVCNYLEVTHVS
jgi:hypothetical protein